MVMASFNMNYTESFSTHAEMELWAYGFKFPDIDDAIDEMLGDSLGLLIERHKGRMTINENGCWIPNLKPLSNGYCCTALNGKTKLLHRLSYEYHNNVAPKAGTHIHHKCNNRRCFNPDHLEEELADEHTRKTFVGTFYNRNRVRSNDNKYGIYLRFRADKKTFQLRWSRERASNRNRKNYSVTINGSEDYCRSKKMAVIQVLDEKYDNFNSLDISEQETIIRQLFR